MSQADTAHAWWSRLRHQGLLLSPVVMIERYPIAPPAAKFPALPKLRDARTRFESQIDTEKKGADRDEAAILGFTDALLEGFVGHTGGRLAKQHNIPENLTAVVRIGSRSDTIRPHRVVFADDAGTTPALLVMADTSPQVGRGRGRTVYSRFLELLRGTGHRLGMLTNGQQSRLVYAGLDFESWCEWESDRWFDEGEGTEELCGLRQLLSPDSLKPVKEGVSGLLDGVEESRKRQADLSSVLRENVRQAVELLLEEVSTANRTKPDLFALLVAHGDDRKLTDAEAHEAMFQATVRVVMRLVVCLFAESRQLLPVNDPIYAQSYGVRSLYELLDEVTRYEGGTHALFNRQTAWHRLMALFRLIYNGSGHGAFPMRAYGGVLFRPGNENSTDAVSRALQILEHTISVGDATVYHVLRKLLRGPLPIIKGKSKTFVDGPVDYTDLRTEFIGLIYEGLLDYRLKRTDEQIGPQIFLNLGREPVLPLARLEDMLQNDKKGLKDLLTTLRKEKVIAPAAAEEEETEEEDKDETSEALEETTEEPVVETEESAAALQRTGDYLDSVESAKRWAREAVVLAGLIGKQKAREPDSEYQARIEGEATKLIKRVVATGEFYLVRAGNTRKGTGTFYTRPQLAVPIVHRTLEPLCYDKAADGTLTSKKPEDILALKVCDSSCGSASFLVAALHYMTDALYKSLCHHRKLDDPAQAKKITLPYGRPRTNKEGEELVPFPPNDPQRGDTFAERIKALLRRHVVERCIYGVDINPLAVELARVSLWVETLDPELPFSFLDHKIKVGNSLVGCWLDRVEDYPLKAWEREGGDGKDGPRTQRIEEFMKGEKIGNRRSGDGRIKKEMRQVIDSKFSNQPRLFAGESTTTESIVVLARAEYEQLHDLPIGDPDERERFYRDHIERSRPLCTLTAAMDEWCAVWFWPTDEESLRHVPTPLTFHKPSVEKDTLLERIAQDVKFFHWEMEFPEVFTPERSGFDAMVGNPPWEVMKPNSHEFFSDFDPLYRTYDKQGALHRQKELFTGVPKVAEQWDGYNAHFKALGNWTRNVTAPFDVLLARGKEGTNLAAVWESERRKRVAFADIRHPFRIQGTADLNSYKMFTELSWHILRPEGRFGFLVPTNVYTDLGSKLIRQELLSFGRIDCLYAFQNEKRVFQQAHHAQKQVVLVVTKGGKTDVFRSLFRLGVGDSPAAWEIPHDLLRIHERGLEWTTHEVALLSPLSSALVEVRTHRDLEIIRKIYNRSTLLFTPPPAGIGIRYSRELHMGDDSRLFKRAQSLQEQGYSFDPFGRLRNGEGKCALPLYQGRMISHFDPLALGYVSGTGRTAVWTAISPDSKQVRPQYAVFEDEVPWSKVKQGPKLGVTNVTNSTNRRTMISAVVRDFPAGDSLYTAQAENTDVQTLLLISACLNSMSYDYCLRNRMGGLHVSEFVLSETPFPSHIPPHHRQRSVVVAGQLTLIQRRFAPEWLRLKNLHPYLAQAEWKHWWAVTEADRLRLRVEVDALAADLYGLDPDDFDWIVRDDRKDPKGFYRADRQLPFRERLTGLAAATFRALKDGKWSAEYAAKLSNDEFFEIIDIPEMTTGPEPLIRKRTGCHVWKPESFRPDDPRHGWTWDHCWQDAVAVLGSEEAVRKYLDGNSGAKEETAEGEFSKNGLKDLFDDPIPTDLFGNELRTKPRQKKQS